MTSKVALKVKNLPANAGTQYTWVQSLGCEDPLQKEMATCSSILAWEIPRMEESGGATVCGVEKSRTRLSTHPCHVGEGNLPRTTGSGSRVHPYVKHHLPGCLDRTSSN